MVSIEYVVHMTYLRLGNAHGEPGIRSALKKYIFGSVEYIYKLNKNVVTTCASLTTMGSQK